MPDDVRIGELTLHPYFYEENSEEGKLFIRMKAVVTAEEQDRLFAMKKPRPGLFLDVTCDEGVTRSLRLGQLRWARDGEQLRQEVTLVDPAWDDDAKGHMGWVHDLMEPRTRAEEQIALQAAQLDRLIVTLTEAGVLSAAQATAVSEVPENELLRRRREFLRVNDVSVFDK
jgi:hypothetical protein